MNTHKAVSDFHRGVLTRGELCSLIAEDPDPVPEGELRALLGPYEGVWEDLRELRANLTRGDCFTISSHCRTGGTNGS